MNIQSLLEKIDLFKKVVEESGFKRDMEEYLAALSTPETQSNISSLKDIAEKVRGSLQQIDESGLKEALDIVCPAEESFTDTDHLIEIQTLLNDPTIETSEFRTKLDDILRKLVDQIELDSNDLKAREKTFREYISTDDEKTAADDAIMSVILKDVETITSLKKFAKTLERWNQALLLFHQLVKSKSPKEIGLVEVQNGSIDIIVNIDVDVAVDFIVVLTAGYKAFRAFLDYKLKKEEILSGFSGNKKLLELEKKQESLMLDGIKEEIETKIRELHKLRKKEDKNISAEGIDAAVPRISSLLSDQIVKGNEVKLLTAPKPVDGEDVQIDGRDGLNDETKQIRKLRKQLNPNDTKMLKAKYELPEEETP